MFLKDKHQNPNHVCICYKYKSCVGNRTLRTLELTLGLIPHTRFWICTSFCGFALFLSTALGSGGWIVCRLNWPLCRSHGKHFQGKLQTRDPGFPTQGPADCQVLIAQLSSSCIYIMFIASLSIFIRQPNCFDIVIFCEFWRWEC